MDADLATLVDRIRRGDRLAEQALALRYERPVRALVKRHCRPNEPLAEDIAQEVLADIVERLRCGLIEDPQALPHYLQVAISNRCRAHYRMGAAFSSGVDPDAMADPSAAGADPAVQRAQEEQSRLLRGLVESLPVMRDRELLRRFYFLEETRDEVCSALGIDAAHFHRVVHRARERLRDAWIARESGPAPAAAPMRAKA